MIFAQKLHSEAEMEAGRIAFHKRFAEMENQITVVEPISETICRYYQVPQSNWRIKISCVACRDKTICLMRRVIK